LGRFGAQICCPHFVVQNRCESKTAAQRVFRPSRGAQESLLFEITSDRHGSCSRRRSNPAVWDTSCDSLELDANGDPLLETPRGPLLGCQRNRVNSNSTLGSDASWFAAEVFPKTLTLPCLKLSAKCRPKRPQLRRDEARHNSRIDLDRTPIWSLARTNHPSWWCGPCCQLDSAWPAVSAGPRDQ